VLVDSHCHLTLLDAAAGGVAAVIAKAREAGVGHLLTVSVDLDGFPALRALAESHAGVFASVGVHPNTETALEPSAEQIEALAASPVVIAIGETGLDYYRSEGDLAWQRRRFRTHIAAAKASGKPLIIHSRDAATDVDRIMREAGADAVGGVMHCFVDDWEAAKRALDLGFYISFSGIVTFKNAQQVQDVARRVPLDRLLVETDSPYLAPVPYRGKPNQPAYVRQVAEFIATLRGAAYAQIQEASTENFFKLFRAAQPVGVLN
jgi:TatD DNase family protein